MIFIRCYYLSSNFLGVGAPIKKGHKNTMCHYYQLSPSNQASLTTFVNYQLPVDNMSFTVSHKQLLSTTSSHAAVVGSDLELV